jgi:hypothetical protein
MMPGRKRDDFRTNGGNTTADAKDYEVIAMSENLTR